MSNLHTMITRFIARFSGAEHRPRALAMAILLLCLFSCMSQTAWAQDAGTLSEEGSALLRNGDYSGALAAFDQAIAADPGYMPARVNRGIALLSLGRAQDALLSFEIVLDRDPGNTPAWMYRGDALSSLGRPGDARESYTRAAQLEPGNPLVQERLRNAGAAGFLPGLSLVSMVILIAAVGIVAVLGVGAVLVMRKKGRMGSPVRKEEMAGKPGRPFSLFTKSLRTKSPEILPGPENSAPSPEEDTPGGGGSPAKGKIPDRIISLFSRKTPGAKGAGPVAAGQQAESAPDGPLQMKGSEIFSSDAGNGTFGDPESREQIIGGFNRILADSGIDPSGFRGLSYYAMGHYREALRAFEEERREEQGYQGIRALEASALLKMGRTEDALRSCEAALRDEKGSFEIRRVQGNILERIGRYEEAIRACDEAITQNPHSVEVWAMRARALHGLRRDHEALQSCDRALGMDPSSPDLLRQKAVILADLGRVDDALGTLDQGIATDHRDTSILLEKGRILQRAGRASEALNVFDSALALAPDDHEAWREMALVLHAMKDPLEEAAAWERASALSPGTVGYFIAWGDALHDAGDYLASAKVYLKAIQKTPRDLSTWHRLGKSLYSAGKYRDSAKAFQHITKESPGDGLAWKLLGCSLIRAGRPDEALAAFMEAGSLIPGDPGVAEGIRRAEAAARKVGGEGVTQPPAGSPHRDETGRELHERDPRIQGRTDSREHLSGTLPQHSPPEGFTGLSNSPIPDAGRDRGMKRQGGRYS